MPTRLLVDAYVARREETATWTVPCRAVPLPGIDVSVNAEWACDVDGYVAAAGGAARLYLSEHVERPALVLMRMRMRLAHALCTCSVHVCCTWTLVDASACQRHAHVH